MALMPYANTSQDFLQPGARGEMFINDGIPGHRHDGQRINRSNNNLNINDHDVLNFKYGLDPRLPSQFRYGWAYGYNQIVIPKGRLVAADPFLMVMDTDTNHFFNAVTIANGGKAVRLAQAKDFQEGGALKDYAKLADQLIGRVWVEVELGSGKDGTTLNTDETFLKANGGNVGIDGVVRKDVRPANKPIGILERNEYTRDADAFNGITFGPIRTDALVELPWFGQGEKAMANPWGSAIGMLKPGDLVKSDANGRFIRSPLSETDKTKDQGGCSDMTIAEYEHERQQVVGEIYATDATLLPEGAARYAQWALEDRLRFNDFNPYIWPTTNRAGEDFVENPPTLYQSDFRYPGYPYDRNYMTNDLHMLASTREGLYDPRFDEAHRLDRGIPGLTDGFNAVVKAYGSSQGVGDTALAGNATLKVANIGLLAAGAEFDDEQRREILIKVPDTNVEAVKVTIAGDSLVITKDSVESVFGKFTVVYKDLHKGLLGIKQTTAAEKADPKCPVLVSYVKRGEAGVPTNLDWDGCKGTVRILMNK